MVFRNKVIGSIADSPKEIDFDMGTEVWNIAGGFAHQKILKLVAKLDTYETIAEFGKEEIDFDFYLTNTQNSHRRFEAINRMAVTLSQLCGNVYFAVRPHDVKEVTKCIERVKVVRKYLPSCLIMKENLVSKSIEYQIDERLFRKCLSILSEVKNDINVPMNKAGLIFRRADDIDLSKIVDDIVQGG